MEKRDYDVVVVGSGPNGFAAAITMQQAGLSVLLVEAMDITGGGMSTRQLTLPGFLHDTCSAIHPLAAGSPFFQKLNLEGLEFIYPPAAAAHPFDDGTAAVLYKSMQLTEETLGDEDGSYRRLIGPFVKNWETLAPDILAPLHFPRHPLQLAEFGLAALTSARVLAKRFRSERTRGLWAGMAAHSMQPLSNLSTSAIALVLLSVGHTRGWPLPKGGSGKIAEALARFFISLGGKIETGFYVRSLDQLPSSHAVLFDVSPRQLLEIAGHRFSKLYRWQLDRFRYGMGVFKIDWALDGPIPFTAKKCREAGTVHLGNSFEEIMAAEQLTAEGKHPAQPFVILAQQSLFDDSRAPEGKHTGWAYCHVPGGSTKDMTGIIEKQVERFAPGFTDRIMARNVMNTSQMELYNPNYIGGDINGGLMDVRQLFTRPALRSSPYKTSAKGLYICSSSTPPGGGVHGMCGYYAARKALEEVFKIRVDSF